MITRRQAKVTHRTLRVMVPLSTHNLHKHRRNRSCSGVRYEHLAVRHGFILVERCVLGSWVAVLDVGHTSRQAGRHLLSLPSPPEKEVTQQRPT